MAWLLVAPPASVQSRDVSPIGPHPMKLETSSTLPIRPAMATTMRNDCLGNEQ
jgi:hypothetical protein